MISMIDPSGERFLSDLDRIQAGMERAQRAVTSGLRVSTPSDDPDQVADILDLRSSIEMNRQMRSNLESARSQADAAEKAIGAAVEILDRARTLALQGAGSTVTADTREKLAIEVKALHEQLVALTRTSVAGRFVFSGDRDREPAYDIDLGNPNGVARLHASAATRLLADPSGVTFSFAHTAGEIFDSRNPDDTLAPDNVLAAVNGLRVALENDDQAGIDAALANLRGGSERLNMEIGFYGAVLGKIDRAIGLSEKLEVQWEAALGAARDADLPRSIMEFSQFQTHYEAALAARARRSQASLFDLLG